MSLSEFRAALLAQHAQLMQGLLRPVFEEISHGTGDISADEVVQALQKLGGVTISEAESQARTLTLTPTLTPTLTLTLTLTLT